MSKVINFNADASKTKIGDAPKARIQLRNGLLRFRFTDRSNTSNIKGELLKRLRPKGAGFRVSIPAEYADVLTADTFALEPAKHGWFVLVQGDVAAPAGRVSAA